MTKAELIKTLAPYPDDALIHCHSEGYDSEPCEVNHIVIQWQRDEGYRFIYNTQKQAEGKSKKGPYPVKQIVLLCG